MIEKYGFQQVPSIGVMQRVTEISSRRKRPGKLKSDEIFLLGNPEMPIWGDVKLPTLEGAKIEIEKIGRLTNPVKDEVD